MRPDDGGSSRPPLPEQAGQSERTLYEIYDFQTGIVDLTASDWATSAESVRGLSTEVRGIVNALRGAPDAWSGPAADAAYQTLGKLADSLDVHAEDIDRIEAGLTSAYDSVAAARTDYVTKVRSISLDVDEDDFQRTPFRQPAQASPDLPTVLDQQAYDQAVAGAKAAREQAAAAVLATFTDSMTTATKKLPVDPAEPTPVGDGSSTPGGGGGTGGRGGGTPTGTTYVPPGGGGYLGPGDWTLSPTDGGDDVTGDTDEPEPQPDPWPPVDPPVDPLPPVLDGPVDGSTGPGGVGVGAPVPGSTGTPAPIGGQVGAGGAAVGMGGMLAGGGAAALFGRGGMPGGGGAGRMSGSVLAAGGTGGAAGRTGGPAGTGGTGRSSVLAAGGQGAAGRGATGGRGSAGGGVRTGRYGVPKLGEQAAGRGGVVGGGAAGGRGGGGKGERTDPQEVDHLTREDEETWFEGAEDATPPVWE